MLDLATVGAGGGTLCRGSHHGRLLVGPQSAGADPGPACYGKGGKDATVTDANLVRGLLDPSYYLGGQMQLDVEAAEQALETTLAAPLNLEIPVAATAAARLNEVHMADAIKVLAAQRGVDLSATTLVACGGAGPLHACAVADELGVRSVLVPQFPGAFSAVGLLGSDVMQDFVQTLITSLLPPNEAAIFRQFGLLEARARESLTRQGFHPADIDVRREVDARYAGQGFELRLPAPYDDELAKTLRDAFHAEHERIYGHAAHEEPVEIVSYRVRAVVTMPTPDFEASSIGPDHAETDEPQYRRIFHVDEWIRAQVVRRSQLSGTSRLVGPVVVEQPDTTTLVPPGWALEVDAMGNLVLSQEAAE
jgi:N-methylhydantoinase A